MYFKYVFEILVFQTVYTLQHWPSPSKRWSVSHTTHGTRLSS